jgi:hypothetical protein
MGLALAKQADLEDDDVAFADKPPKERHRILKTLLLAGIFFLWDSKRGRFISTKTGRAIRADQLRRWVIEASEKSEERLAALAEKLTAGTTTGQIVQGEITAGKITEAQFQRAMQQEIVKAESAMTASAVGGLKAMKPPQWAKVAVRISQQQTALVGFGRDIVTSKLSPAEIAARARLYARAIYATHMNEMTDLKQGMGARFARRILHQGAIHCEDCPPLAEKGWVPIDQLVPIGDTECIVNCRCAIEYSGEGQPSAATMIGMPD